MASVVHSANRSGAFDVSEDGAHATARDAFVIMSTLLTPSVPRAYLGLCAQILQERHMRDVFEERSVQLRCGWPLCRESIANRRQQKYRVSLAKQQLYNAREEQQFCGVACLEEARQYVASLPIKAPQMLPSLTQVFGTSKPQPKDYDDTVAPRPSTTSSVPLAKRPILGPSSTSRRAPTKGPKVVWAKQPGMGVVEKDVHIIENPTPAPPSTDFSQANAVLIEGYIFPAHKGKKASKLAKKLQATTTPTDATDNATDNAVEEEMFTSDEGSSSESSYADEDSSSDDSDGNIDTYSAADLPAFATLWWKVSEMVTPATLQLVASWHGRASAEPVEAPVVSSTDLDDRRLLFGTFCMKQMPVVIEACRKQLLDGQERPVLTSDRGVQMNMNDVVQTLHLRQPMEGTWLLEWNAMCLLLLLVVHRRTPTTWQDAISPESLKALTGLDVHEMHQLMGVFCETIPVYVLADQMDGPAASVKAITTADTSSTPRGVQCRKCRHRTCQCKAKAAKGDDRSDFSDAEIAAMMHESLKIQEMAEFGALD